jgi:O-antigen/teichoic acid export membrane protein
MYVTIKDGKYKEIKKVVNLILLLMAVLVFILMAIAPEIIKIFATAEYSEAKYVIPPVAASVFFNFMYAVFCNVEFYYEKTKFVMVASIGAAVLNIVLNWMFIPIWGYLAAGYTTLVSYIIYCFAHYMFCRIICKKQKINNDMFDIRFILITSIIVVLSAIIFSILYKYTVVRFIIILIIISAVFVKRNSIISQLSILKRR